MSVKLGERSLSASPRDGGSRGTAALHSAHSTELSGDTGTAAAKRLTTGTSNTTGTHSCSRACIPKQLRRGKQAALLSTSRRGRKIRNQGEAQAKAPGNSFCLPAAEDNSHQTFKPLWSHHHSLKPFGARIVCASCNPLRISRKEYLGLLLLF